MSSVDAIIDNNRFSEWIGLQTNASKLCLTKQLKEWKYNEQQLLHLSAKFKRFKDAFERDPTFFGKCYELFEEVSLIEKQLNNLLYNNSTLEKESYNEILFFKPMLQPLNFVPFLLSVWSAIRVYVLPGISLLFPIILLIAPYIILKVIFTVPITFKNYMNILQSMVTGNFQKITNPNALAAINSTHTSPISYIKPGMTIIVTLLQGFIQPYWTYKHLHSIDSIIQDNGKLILRFRDIYHRLESLLSSHGFTFFKCPLPDLPDERDATARIMLQSFHFKLALKYIGSLEVIMCLADKRHVKPVHWLHQSTPAFHIKDAFDFQVPENQRKPIRVSFDEKRHALLTGPNKGGKSTVLRALSMSALLAHTYGCSFGEATMTPFKKLFVCLKPDDLPGSKSRFEREIEFTANTLTHKENILVFIDELYHSTNPPDALRSCDIYCEQLWKKTNIVSVISTHLFDLVEKSEESIQRLCCPAHIDKEGDIHFEYALKRGICTVSSVDTLLKMNGLLA